MKWFSAIIEFVLKILRLLAERRRAKQEQAAAERARREAEARETEKRIQEKVDAVPKSEFRPGDPLGVDEFNRGRPGV